MPWHLPRHLSCVICCQLLQESRCIRCRRNEHRTKKAGMVVQKPMSNKAPLRKVLIFSTGCVTCKARRRKCDEKKPSCSQCLRRKTACGGYQAEFRWREFEKPGANSISSGNNSKQPDPFLAHGTMLRILSRWQRTTQVGPGSYWIASFSLRRTRTPRET